MDAGRELDALVAGKVMGWHVPTEIFHYWYPPDLRPESNALGHDLKPYSTDISAAWLVVEKLDKDGYALALQAPGSTDMSERYHVFHEWTAEFQMNGEARSDTAPLAICLAALKAVGYHFDRKEPNS